MNLTKHAASRGPGAWRGVICVGLLVFSAAAITTGCSTIGGLPTSPGTVAGSTVLDERAALGVELAYKAAGTALETATDAGLLKGPAAVKAGQLEAKAYAAVKAARAAYRAGNAADYATALDTARGAVADLLAALKK